MVQLETNNSVQDFYSKGLDYLKVRNYLTALEYFNQALTLEPNNVNIWDKHSITLRELGRYYEADVSKSKVHQLYYSQELRQEEDLPLDRNSLELVPAGYAPGSIETRPHCTINQADYWVEVANRAYHNFDFASEADAYMKAIEIQPDNYSNWYNLGIALRKLKVYDMAIHAYQNVLRIAPAFHLAWNGLGNAFRDTRQYDKAATAYHKALELEPNFHYAWHGLGNTCRAKGEYVAAIEAYEKAIRINARYHLSWHGLGNAFRDLGCHRQAIFAYEMVMKIAPSFWRAWDGKGAALLSLGEAEDAIDTWQSGIDTLETHLPFNHEGCGELYFRLGYHQYLQSRRAAHALPCLLEAKANYGKALYHLEQTPLSDRYQEILKKYEHIKNLCHKEQQSRLKVS